VVQGSSEAWQYWTTHAGEVDALIYHCREDVLAAENPPMIGFLASSNDPLKTYAIGTSAMLNDAIFHYVFFRDER
jgi:hypothetical protein